MKENLKKRGVVDSPLCSLCHLEENGLAAFTTTGSFFMTSRRNLARLVYRYWAARFQMGFVAALGIKLKIVIKKKPNN